MNAGSQIGRLRLAAQRLVGADGTATGAVRHLTAMQAQDFPGVVVSIALRTRGRSRTDVAAAFDAGDVVVSWPLRGTLHAVAAEDLGWLLALGTPRVLAGAAARRAALGLDDAMFDRAHEVAVAALQGGRRLRRDALLAAWDAAGVATDGQRGYHLLWQLAQTATLCLGPLVDGRPAIALVDEWIRAPRRLTRDEALGELALRYFQGHGPATVRDFVRWAQLLAADARAGLAIAAPRLERVVVDGVDHFRCPQVADRLAGAREQADGVLLLPGFDEFVLGYRDRDAVLDPAYAQRIVPGGNGVFRPTVVAAGRIVGTWRHTGRGAARTLRADPFDRFAPAVEAGAADAYACLP
ncbi:winged helix DNA-binding domain-containing protein [Micromonospora sp. LOL_023]|uniref:winged helix DNA-binding domain-containing protein n=1 Tax=Micromonospora sp. LOL_023 TaxID=3345418 RepID=UPI003A877632